MIPMELITMLGSSVLGGALKIWSQSLEARHQEHQRMMEASNAQASIYSKAREFKGGWGFQWTRRFIAITAVLSIIVLPKTVPLIFPDIPIIVSSYVWESSLFSAEPFKLIEWNYATGIFITPLDTHLMSAIIGLFFGSEITKRR